MSPEVQNRGISGPRKGHVSFTKKILKKKKKNLVLSSVVSLIWKEIDWGQSKVFNLNPFVAKVCMKESCLIPPFIGLKVVVMSFSNNATSCAISHHQWVNPFRHMP